MVNSLNLIFGPKLPTEFENVGIAFLAAPTMRPDFAIGALSAERYAPENYAHVDEDIIVFDQGGLNSDQILNINYTFDPTTFGSRFTSLSVPDKSGTAILNSQTWGFPILDTPIELVGLHVTTANTWCPLIKPGTVWRKYTITTAEPASSWLRRSGLVDGDTVVLIYSVPELAYSPSSQPTTQWPPNTTYYQNMKEIASPIGPRTISYQGDVHVVTKIKINGVTLFTGSWTDGASSSVISGIDYITKSITITSTVQADDYVELEYQTYKQYYIYTGFRSYNNVWYPFNANPEYGNYIGDDATGALRSSADCLLGQVTIYALPSAYLDIRPTNFQPTAGSSNIGTFNMKFVRGIDYGETHFIRHTISGERKESVSVKQGYSTVSTWGEAKFGRNFYDEIGNYETDVYSDIIPSMVPLGRVVLTAPAAVNSVAVADIRQRGGGVPVDFNMAAVDTTADGIDTLRGYLDMGIWEGKAVKQGGVIEIKIDKSILKTDDTDTNPDHFTPYEIYEIVRSQVPPGIDFEIIYTDM